MKVGEATRVCMGRKLEAFLKQCIDDAFFTFICFTEISEFDHTSFTTPAAYHHKREQTRQGLSGCVYLVILSFPPFP